MANRAVQYAESELGVHSTYDLLITQVNQAAQVASKANELRHQKRLLEEETLDREYELASDERGKHHDMSVTGMKEHLKAAIHRDPAHRALRMKSINLARQIDELDGEKAVLDSQVRVYTARIIELGGYFEYLAAVKTHETLTKTMKQAQPATPETLSEGEQDDSGNPWR